jgi:hypothetical protein
VTRRAWRWIERRRWPRFTFRDLIILALVGATLTLTAHYEDSSQAAARRQGERTEQRICLTMHRLASRNPPHGPPSDKSRQYLAWLHATLVQLGPDIGCRPDLHR